MEPVLRDWWSVQQVAAELAVDAEVLSYRDGNAIICAALIIVGWVSNVMFNLIIARNAGDFIASAVSSRRSASHRLRNCRGSLRAASRSRCPQPIAAARRHQSNQ